jgi:hypothetical protein
MTHLLRKGSSERSCADRLPFAALWRYEGNVAEARSVAVPIAFRWWNGSRNARKLLEMYEFRVLGSLDLRGPDGEKVLSVLAQPKNAAQFVLPCRHPGLPDALLAASLPVYLGSL